MRVLFFIKCFVLCYFGLLAQNNFPNPLPFKTFDVINKSKGNEVYNFSKPEKKAFLIYDLNSQTLAEVMFNGCNFVFNERNITIFPVFYSGQLVNKGNVDIGTKIPTQLYRTPETSVLKDFNLVPADFPLLIVYNEKNELCGFSKNVEGIADIDCGIEMVKFKVLRLKIMVEEKNKNLTPYADKEIVILGCNKNDTVAKLITNKYGDFNAELPDIDQDYLITVNEKTKNKSINFVLLGTQSGKVVGKFKSTDKGFEYKLLKTELVTLPDIKIEEDLEMKFTNFKSKSVNNFVITETLYYELGESSLSEGSKKLLQNIKKVLDGYPEFVLRVISHTDAQGDDQSNLALSLKRSEVVIDYLNSLGIKIERLSAEGKGETEIRNRCVNNVDCSDKEHEFNRRTEFKFTKK
ncbi:MAG: OmpA family protein [Bacteroidia bacterium]|nr:OmpA family protein [Bacteroidia bacterium]